MSDVPAGWLQWLPYGSAFRFIDDVIVLDLPKRIVTTMDYRRHAALIDAHRVAGAAIVPGALLAEQAAQSAWLLGRCSGWLTANSRAVLGRLNCTFERPAPAEIAVTAEVHDSVSTPDSAGFRAILRSNDTILAKITMAVRRFDD